MNLPPRQLRRRAGGVLLHLTSLPGGHGIGDLGESAQRFASFLAEADVGWWQMLPVNPIGDGDSPYNSPSTFAGNPLLIDLRGLLGDGWLAPADLHHSPEEGSDVHAVAFDRVRPWKEERLRRAAARFHERASAEQRDAMARFAADNRHWLDDYALHQTLREMHGSPWTAWPEALRERDPRALAQARSVHARAIEGRFFEQWVFDRQWRALRARCAAANVGLLGDVPIYVAHDSAEVWANRELFQLDERGDPAAMAGVPSDYFAEKGQLWGNPLYAWNRHEEEGFRWWRQRLESTLSRFDAVRLDHFIGFERFWAVPAGAPDARTGRWRKGPGVALFRSLPEEIRCRLVAEDLGVMTSAVHALRNRFDLPGMRVMQFGFSGDDGSRPHLPHEYPRRCVAYTATHDYDTIAGWLENPVDWKPNAETFERTRRFALDYLGATPETFARAAVRTLWMSPAELAVVPLQDLLGLGSEARMNRPGTPTGNWRWRFAEGDVPPETSSWLRRLSQLYDRSSSRNGSA